jgi:hypothetical protein
VSSRSVWRLEGRVIVTGDGRNRRVVVGETCGAPTLAVAVWIADRYNYDTLVWWRRCFRRAPKPPKEAQ